MGPPTDTKEIILNTLNPSATISYGSGLSEEGPPELPPSSSFGQRNVLSQESMSWLIPRNINQPLAQLPRGSKLKTSRLDVAGVQGTGVDLPQYIGHSTASPKEKQLHTQGGFSDLWEDSINVKTFIHFIHPLLYIPCMQREEARANRSLLQTLLSLGDIYLRPMEKSHRCNGRQYDIGPQFPPNWLHFTVLDLHPFTMALKKSPNQKLIFVLTL